MNIKYIAIFALVGIFSVSMVSSAEAVKWQWSYSSTDNFLVNDEYKTTVKVFDYYNYVDDLKNIELTIFAEIDNNVQPVKIYYNLESGEIFNNSEGDYYFSDIQALAYVGDVKNYSPEPFFKIDRPVPIDGDGLQVDFVMTVKNDFQHNGLSYSLDRLPVE